jgi:DNA-directed RNA polymerase specialized sigma24 family protein
VNATKDNPFILLDSDEPHLAKLDPKFVEPLRLAHAGNGYYWISGQLSVPLGTVKSRINRARERIIKMREAEAIMRPAWKEKA